MEIERQFFRKETLNWHGQEAIVGHFRTLNLPRKSMEIEGVSVNRYQLTLTRLINYF
jgi:hypothetical protein